MAQNLSERATTVEGFLASHDIGTAVMIGEHQGMVLELEDLRTEERRKVLVELKSSNTKYPFCTLWAVSPGSPLIHIRGSKDRVLRFEPVAGYLGSLDRSLNRDTYEQARRYGLVR